MNIVYPVYPPSKFQCIFPCFLSVFLFHADIYAFMYVCSEANIDLISGTVCISTVLLV